MALADPASEYSADFSGPISDNLLVDSLRVPFRWDLVGRDQIGSLLSGTESPRLWFLPELLHCTGKVLARSGNGDLYFVGRSLDSMFDLLGGVLADIERGPRLRRLPFSFDAEPLSATHLARAREVCAGLGLDPYSLVRRRKPVTFVDVVYRGRTFARLFDLLAGWVDETREPWDVARRKLRFVGVTIRERPSPHTYRWQQHASWTARLPADAVRNVSMSWDGWNYFGNYQRKLTDSFHSGRWLADPGGPDHGERTRQALAEARAVALAGRDPGARRAIARAIRGEPGLAQPWLRALVRGLSGRGPPLRGVGHAPRSTLRRRRRRADRRKVGKRTLRSGPVRTPRAGRSRYAAHSGHERRTPGGPR
jgi:hypothetical protein